MDDLLNVDFNLIDEHLLSFPFEDLGCIDPPEVESILKELEDEAAALNCSSTTQSALNGRAKGFYSKSKLRANGVSLLAKPPRKKKPRSSGSSLLHTVPAVMVEPTETLIISASSHFDHEYCRPRLPLVSSEPSESFSTDAFGDDFLEHDVDSYFNSFFTTTNTTSDCDLISRLSSDSSDGSCSPEPYEPLEISECTFNFGESLLPPLQTNVNERKELSLNSKVIDMNDLNEYELSKESASDSSECEQMDVEIIVLEDDHSSSKKISSGDEQEVEEDDDILMNADILIEQIFSDFSDVEYVTSSSAHTNKSMSICSSKSVTISAVPASQSKNNSSSNRKPRALSNSYSVRSNSACSCSSSEELSEEDSSTPNPQSTSKKLIKKKKKLINKHSRISLGSRYIRSNSGEMSADASDESGSCADSSNEQSTKINCLANLVYVSQIPESMNKRDLRFWFSRFGSIEKMRVRGGRFGRRSACVAYRKATEAYEAVRRGSSEYPQMYMHLADSNRGSVTITNNGFSHGTTIEPIH